ncbi:MAG: zinc-dependent peptidase [Planctomycetes bacterium]|nr:zinc-dependent peptidase [Planctomycetota bacterium]
MQPPHPRQDSSGESRLPPGSHPPQPQESTTGTATPLAERRDRRLARLTAAAILLVPAGVVAWRLAGPGSACLCLTVQWALAGLWYHRATAVHRRRRRLWAEPLAARDEAVLRARVPHFRALTATGRERFRQRVKLFLAETAIHGADVAVGRRLRLLTAAAAVIPSLGFAEWEWRDLHEVILRARGNPGGGRVEEDGLVTEFAESGMVGDAGVFAGVMMLAADDLLWEFAHPETGDNVGIHEFAHLMARQGLTIAPEDRPGWPALLARERRRIAAGESLLDDYALADQDEFFATASERFFSVPQRLARHHPELYAVLARTYRQDPRGWLPDPCRTPPRLLFGRRKRYPGRGRRRRGHRTDERRHP